MIACRLVRCGSSVYVQKKSSCAFFGVDVDACSCCDVAVAFSLLRVVVKGCEMVAVVTDAGILNIDKDGRLGVKVVMSRSQTGCRV